MVINVDSRHSLDASCPVPSRGLDQPAPAPAPAHAPGALPPGSYSPPYPYPPGAIHVGAPIGPPGAALPNGYMGPVVAVPAHAGVQHVGYCPEGVLVAMGPVAAPPPDEGEFVAALAVLVIGIMCYYPLLLANLVFWNAQHSGARTVARVSVGLFVCISMCVAILMVWVATFVGVYD